MNTVKKLGDSLWQYPEARNAVPHACRQIVLVQTSGWNERTATLHLIERGAGKWNAVPDAIWPVDIGQGGLGIGSGLWSPDPVRGPIKREGDRRAPAGLFPLREAFGYAPLPPPGCALPYRQATERDYFIDDSASPDYNRWVRIVEGPNLPRERWRSFERMRMATDQYRLGIVVEHNRDPIVPGRGSCIFLHLWQEPGRGTAGCTAMAQSTLTAILAWLDPSCQPLLLQMPGSAEC